MPTLDNLPDDILQVLTLRAALNERSVEAEVCEILATAVKPEKRVPLGDALSAFSRNLGLTNADFEVLSNAPASLNLPEDTNGLVNRDRA